MKKRYILLIILSVLLCSILLSSCSIFGGGGKSSYTITLVSNGGTSHAPITIGQGSNDITLPEPTRTGYTFGGWFTRNTFNESWSQYLQKNNYTITSDITLYAKWYAISGDVKLFVNGGNALSTISIPYSAGVEMDLPIPTRKGNVFDGWFDNHTLPNAVRVTDATGVFQSEETAKGDINLYAHWLVSVSILPREEVGTVTKGRGYYYIGDENTNWIQFSAQAASHYTFLHWMFGDDVVEEDTKRYTFTEDVDIYAVFQGVETTLTADPNCEGKDDVEYTVYYGETFVIPVPTNPGYVFEGWYSDPIGGTKLSDRRGKFSSYQHYQDLTVYARWQEGTFSTDYNYEANGSPATSYKITGYKGSDDILYIPYDLGGIPVVEITNSFSAVGHSAVVIPSSITTIAPNAFSGYTGKIYFDQGFESLSLINTTNFSQTHNIYVHGTYVISSNITSTSGHTNTLVSSGAPNLIDDVYYDFLGNIADSHINSYNELQAFLNYHLVYSVGNEIALSIEYSNDATTEINKAINNAGFYRHNTLLQEQQVSYTHSEKRIKLPALVEKTEGRFASNSTEDPSVVVLPPFIYSYEKDESPEAREFPIDSCNPYVVFNSEQLVYAVEKGFMPVFSVDSVAKTIYENVKSILLEIIPQDADDFQKITIIHDWILDNVVYDHNLLDLSVGGSSGSTSLLKYNGFYLEGVFMDGKAVCDGLSKAFMLMCRIEGIEAIRVTGTTVQSATNVGHAWNKVKILDKWYSIDLTGDDISIPRSNSPSGGYYEIRSHKYFLISDTLMGSKNVEEKNIDNPFYVYYESKGTYDYFKETEVGNTGKTLYIENAAQRGIIANAFLDFVSQQTEPGRYAIELVFKGDTNANYEGFTCTIPYKLGEKNDYFVVLMIDRN